MRRANGDTYHVTNCSPQIAAFNQSGRQGVWGKLEDLVQTQAATETYSVFAGPILRDDDPPFEGVDDRGRTTVKIPQSFWKIIVARSAGGLQTFAFKLDQDLSGVDFTELAFDSLWRTRMIGVRDLENAIRTLRFPDVLSDTDQSDTDLGESIRGEAGLWLQGTSLRDRHRVGASHSPSKSARLLWCEPTEGGAHDRSDGQGCGDGGLRHRRRRGQRRHH